MAPRSILYLTVEGVLIPRTAASIPERGARWSLHDDSSHLRQLTEILAENAHIAVVLHSVLVPRVGFRTIVQTFPGQLRSRIVGATVPGNRVIRKSRLDKHTNRYSWLSEDVSRRDPRQVTVLEGDARCVPVPLRERAVIVSAGLWAASRADWTRLRDLLTSSI